MEMVSLRSIENSKGHYFIKQHIPRLWGTIETYTDAAVNMKIHLSRTALERTVIIYWNAYFLFYLFIYLFVYLFIYLFACFDNVCIKEQFKFHAQLS